MPYLNLDFDFFDHPKTRRLRALCGPGAETLILRIWAHCGKFHPDDGIMEGYSVGEIEEIAGWKGNPGEAVAALLTVRYLERCSSNAQALLEEHAQALQVHDWTDHQGHIAMLKARAKAAATARWSKRDKSDAQGMLKQCSSISSSNASRGEGREVQDGTEGLVQEGESEGKPDRYHKDCRAVLHILNEASGAHFREVDSNLALITARLKEPDVDIAGVRLMIERQCKRWKGTPQAEFLRPETLFGKTKFDSYYANRELPINQENGKPGTKGFDRNAGTANEGRAHLYKNVAQSIGVQAQERLPAADARTSPGV